MLKSCNLRYSYHVQAAWHNGTIGLPFMPRLHGRASIWRKPAKVKYFINFKASSGSDYDDRHVIALMLHAQAEGLTLGQREKSMRCAPQELLLSQIYAA